MQIQWLQRTLSYWNKLVANKAESELLDVDPSKDWKTHMQQLLPIENPRGMAGPAKQKFAGSY